jgi:hypothetical protein
MPLFLPLLPFFDKKTVAACLLSQPDDLRRFFGCCGALLCFVIWFVWFVFYGFSFYRWFSRSSKGEGGKGVKLNVALSRLTTV